MYQIEESQASFNKCESNTSRVVRYENPLSEQHKSTEQENNIEENSKEFLAEKAREAIKRRTQYDWKISDLIL